MVLTEGKEMAEEEPDPLAEEDMFGARWPNNPAKRGWPASSPCSSSYCDEVVLAFVGQQGLLGILRHSVLVNARC
ncbi:hypothetical protein SERLA73DRAFT_71459 [Serpula lacrymans var. lacrymans S7.3]|uniref:Uncharacterized protein n=1 Tax=Serpula lacrymans var. lacrymans (strain S7.3) TaxID=936435 RepID=F8PR33_SERL3|nr:hypothetical protein SERLA73DRAFT_71459 [Serpula lacrymans var. lacrymans S7.3]